ncbi:hypothetical protein [Methylocystis sp.]|uniref:hypothetical protein n=1 Tax=Methylocystis sp. TaxID=1911079 RepID=UPI003DA64D64
MASYSVMSYTPEWRESYMKFVEKNFGRSAYQGRQRYLDWLYMQNPHGRRYRDFSVVVLDNSEVVGCIHKLRFELSGPGETATLNGVAVQNLMVDVDHRNGAGFLLFRDIISKDRLFVAPGAIGEVAAAYEKLCNHHLQAYWGSKFVHPRVMQLIRRFSGGIVTRESVLESWDRIRPEGAAISLDYSEKLDHVLSDVSPDVSLRKDFLKWRLFDETRVRTIALFDNNGKSCLLLVVGKRKKIPVCRVFFTKFDNKEAGVLLMKAAFNLAGELGCLVALITSNDPNMESIGINLKIKTKNPPPQTYIYAKKTKLESLVLWPLVSDLGLEEIFGEE